MSAASLRGKRVTVLLGGTSPEREISLQSGATVVAALEQLGVSVRSQDPGADNWLSTMAATDIVFIALHGCPGEDGVIQGTLQTLGLRYTGSGVLASALTMDKVASKRLWRGLGLPTAEFVTLAGDSDWQAVMGQLGPVFVKPATGGSSIATGVAENARDLQRVWQRAAATGSAVIAEKLIDGPEYTVAILGDRALPVISMQTDNPFYDYEAKYLSDETRYLCPCGLPEAEEREVQQLALRAFRATGCEVWGRVDLMRDGDGQFLLLEVNTVPGMTSHSLVPMAARAAGIELTELVGLITTLSLEGSR